MSNCFQCKKPIPSTEDCVETPERKKFHINCFACYTCKKIFDGANYLNTGANYFCEQCFVENFAQSATVESRAYDDPDDDLLPGLIQNTNLSTNERKTALSNLGLMTNSKIASLSRKTLFGICGPGDAKTGDKLVYSLSCTNENGDAKELTNASALQACVKLSSNPSASTPCTISNPIVGQYDLVCSVQLPGAYELQITLNGNPLFGEDKTVYTNITGPVNKSSGLLFAMEGDALEYGRIGEDNFIHVKVRNSGTNGLTDVETSAVQVLCFLNNKTNNNTIINMKVNRISQGLYKSVFKVSIPGEYKLLVKYYVNDRWMDVVSKIAYFSDESDGGLIVDRNMVSEKVSKSSLVSFKIQSVDKNGNKVKAGGDDWQLLASGPAGVDDVMVMDERDGSYTCEMKFNNTGNYLIQVVLRGNVDARGSPLKFEVV